MKRWKIFMFISIGALILVNGAFIFVEDVYIKGDDKIVVKEIEEEDTANVDAVEITIDNGAENIQANYSGQYIACNEDGKIKVIDTKDNSQFDYGKVTDGEIEYFKWVSGEKNLLVMEKVKEDDKYYLKPVVLNAKTKEAETLIDFNKKEIKLLISDNESIENIIFATANNTYYIQLKNKDGKSDLYSVNVMNELSKVKKEAYIDNVVSTPAKTKPFLEIESKIALLDSKSYIDIPGVEKYKLIGADKNDKIYVGNEKDGKVTELYSSEVKDDNSFSWEKINLDEPLNMSDIKIDYSGKVYLIYKDKNIIKEATKGQSVKYKGEVIQSYSDGIIAIEDWTISKLLIN